MNKGKNKLYRTSQWESFRERILQRDNYTCCRCGRSSPEVKLQVHHLHYYPPKKPWEYLDIDLITLCSGCHAQEHGKIMPQSGWEYCGEDDLGDVIGTCEACGNQIRYEHLIHHLNWGWLTVGCLCADRLTGNTEASETEKRRKEEAKKFKTFRDSLRWKHNGQRYYRSYKSYDISIWDNITSFRIDISFNYVNKEGFYRKERLPSHKKYPTLDDAKYSAFNAITSGVLETYIKKHYGALVD